MPLPTWATNASRAASRLPLTRAGHEGTGRRVHTTPLQPARLGCPGAMVIVGAHYLPSVFLYGMRHYAALAAILAFGGVGLALWGPESFSLGAWITSLVLVSFAFLLRASVAAEFATDTHGALDHPGGGR